MTLMQEVVFHTIKAIKSYGKFDAFEENIGILRELTKKFTIDYLEVKPNLKKCPIKLKELKAPVMYYEICENSYFTMAVFVMKPGSRMPMHDHPNMHGILKVLHGSTKVKSYNIERKPIIQTEFPIYKILQKSSARLNADSDAIFLTPENGNIHKISPITAPVAFLDILFPPYNYTDREFTVYEQVSLTSATTKTNSNFKEPHFENNTNNSNSPKTSFENQISTINDKKGDFLQVAPAPMDYWCDTIPYTGPSIPPGYVESLMERNDI